MRRRLGLATLVVDRRAGRQPPAFPPAARFDKLGAPMVDLPSDPLAARWRDEFPILARTTYLVSHSLGAMPRGVYERLRGFADEWAARGVRAWFEGWWDMPVRAGDRVARIIGAPPGSVAMQQNVSLALAIALSCFDDWRPPRNKIVATALDCPPLLYACAAQERLGARFVAVEGARDGIEQPLGPMLEAIDEETRLVATSQVLYKTSYLQDVAAIVARAHEVGALVLLDAYQSAGTVPLDVTALEVDFAVGGSVKWLCGGPGAGYLYVRPDLAPRLAPRITGWAAHAAPFAFEPPPVRLAGAPPAARFLHGSPHVPALFSAAAGHEIVAEVGVEAIRAKSQRQTQRLVDGALERGFRVHTPRVAARRGGVVTIDVGEASERIADELCRREVLVDFRPGAGIRISPHFYTLDEEVDRVLEEIEELARVV